MSIGRVQHLASAALPAAGAWSAQVAFPLPHTLKAITAWVTYTRGTTNGQVRLRALFGNGVEEAPETAISATLTPTEPTATQAAYQHDIDSPIPANASPITFTLPFNVPPGATTFRVLAAEIGVTGTPGTCAIVLTGSV